MSSKNIIYSSVFLGPFTKLIDPRRSNATLYNFHEILVIALSACIAGADNFVAMERFGKAKIAFFEEHLDLANGIPSHDTFGDLFALLDPVEFNKCFMNWIANKTRENDLKFIAIDGKALRGSHYKSHSKKMIHTVNAWATEQQCFLGQCCTDVKSNEITAIPKLLKMMWIEGAVITIDAMGTQKRIASQIILQKGHYIVPGWKLMFSQNKEISILLDLRFTVIFTQYRVSGTAQSFISLLFRDLPYRLGTVHPPSPRRGCFIIGVSSCC